MRPTISVFLLTLYCSCGTVLSTKRYENEREKRKETESQFEETRRLELGHRGMLISVTQSENLQWVYNEEFSVETYEKAMEICKDIGFDLPSKEQIVAEGAALTALAPAIADEKIVNLIYLQDVNVESQDWHLGKVVCVREITNN